MKNISIKTTVAIITFVVGVTFAIFWLKLPSKIPIVSDISTVSEESEDYAIYSVALNEVFTKYSGELLVISDKTSNEPSIDLKPKFNIPIKYVFLDEEKYDEELLLSETNSKQKSNKPHISEFFEEHSKALGIVRLSQVRFNDARTEADVQVELIYCPLCGFGKRVHLEKSLGLWRVKNISDMWVS